MRSWRARFIERRRRRYDEDLTAPSASELEDLAGRIFPCYFGGSVERGAPAHLRLELHTWNVPQRKA